MTVADIVEVLVPFDEGLAVVFGAAVAVFLVERVIEWFVRVVRADA